MPISVDRIIRTAVIAGLVTAATGCAPAETVCTDPILAKKSRPATVSGIPSTGPDGDFQLNIFSKVDVSHGGYIRTILASWGAGKDTQLEAFTINPEVVTVIEREFKQGQLTLSLDTVAASAPRINQHLKNIVDEDQKKQLLDKVKKCPAMFERFSQVVPLPNQTPDQNHQLLVFWSDWTYRRIMWDLHDLKPTAP